MTKTTYLVTVTQIDHDVEFVTERWQKLVDVPDENHKELYGYVKSDETRDVETKLFEQSLEKLDLPRLVLTINNTGDIK